MRTVIRGFEVYEESTAKKTPDLSKYTAKKTSIFVIFVIFGAFLAYFFKKLLSSEGW